MSVVGLLNSEEAAYQGNRLTACAMYSILRNVACLLLAALSSAEDPDSTPKKSLKFCANIAFQYLEAPMLERWSLAKQYGFKAVESVTLYGFSIEDVVRAKETAGVQHILINTNSGSWTKNELGFAALPDRKDRFEETLQEAIDYCKALKCKLIQIQAGNIPNPTEENDRTFEENLREAAIKLEKENIVGTIESYNTALTPIYYLNNFTKSLDIVKKINHPNIRLQADLYNMKMMGEDLEKSITEALPYIGHIQIAQSPGRHEPDTCGTIDYRRMLAFLESTGYDLWVGLQYDVLSGTEAGLQWITEMGYTL